MKALSPLVMVCLLSMACASTPRTKPSATATGGHAAMGMSSDTADFLDPIDYIPSALGPHTWKITTSEPRAQQYFDQGMQLRWAYSVDDAARSMAEARRIDPKCAMCYWGEAFTLGSFLNGGMSALKAPYAHEAIEKAVALADGVTPLERDLIMATRVRCPADYDPDSRRPVDEAFAAEMARVHAKYPDNHDVATVYAVALFMLEERRGYRDVNDPDLKRLYGVLTGVIEEDITHPGACHLYIHATESSQRPDLALECADHLSDAVPVASHLQHMPSHTWNVVGSWGRSVRANTRAWHSDLKAAANQGFSYAPSHNLHMLLFAASFDGQGAVATQAGKDYGKLTGDTMYQVLTLLRFGRFDEIPAVTHRPTADVAAGMWDFAQGYAALRSGDRDAAQKSLAKVQDAAATSDDAFRRHSAENLLGTVGHILEGEMQRDSGDLDGAIASFQKAVEYEDKLEYDEPEVFPFAPRHWLGAALLEAGRDAEAEQVYRDELADHPHNGWSLYGLRQALSAQGKTALGVDLDFQESWSRSDVWIVASRF